MDLPTGRLAEYITKSGYNNIDRGFYSVCQQTNADKLLLNPLELTYKPCTGGSLGSYQLNSYNISICNNMMVRRRHINCIISF